MGILGDYPAHIRIECDNPASIEVTGLSVCRTLPVLTRGATPSLHPSLVRRFQISLYDMVHEANCSGRDLHPLTGQKRIAQSPVAVLLYESYACYARSIR